MRLRFKIQLQPDMQKEWACIEGQVTAKIHRYGRWQEVTRLAVRAKLQPESEKNGRWWR